MTTRILIVVAAILWYTVVRYAIYHYMCRSGRTDDLDWVFSWILALFVAFATIFIPALLARFVWCGDLMCR